MVSMRAQYQEQFEDLRLEFIWTKVFLREAAVKNRSEQTERAWQNEEALRTEIREHRANRVFV